MDTLNLHGLRRISGAGLSLAVVAAALVAMPTAATAAAAPAFGTTWVTSPSGNSVTELSPTGAKLGTIKGASTGLADPQEVVANTAGHIFVANLGGNSITEYAAGATGNAAPIATISGSQTGLSGPTGIAIAGSQLWVSDANTNTLEDFTAGANGNVLPIETISGSRTLLDHPQGLFLTHGGLALWVVNDPAGRAPRVTRFTTFGGGNKAPAAQLGGARTRLSDPTAVAVGLDDVVYVTNAHSNSVTEYSEGVGNTPPTVVLSGAATKIQGPTGLGLDALGRLSVANAGDGSLRVFSRGAHGNAAPIRSVTGLSDTGGASVLASVPGEPRSLTATAGNHAVHLSWAAPAHTGGGVLRYRVIFLKQPPRRGTGRFSLGSTSATHFTAKPLFNGHTYFFAVATVNGLGESQLTKFVAMSPANVPGAPRAVKLTPHANALTVTWKPPKSDGGRAINRYTLRFATCTIGAKGCHAPSITVKGSRRSLTLKGLSAGTAYHVTLTARNSRGTGKPSKPVTGTPVA
jgi:hypothetical protein